MTEEWRPIAGFEGCYLVSNKGKIYSLWKNRVITPIFNRQTRYYSICLCNGKEQKREYIHRIVAEAFCNKPVGCNCVNHKDENRQNNNADNLEWCTIAYNNSYSDIGQYHRKRVAQVENWKVLRVFESAREAEKHVKTNYKNISAVCRGIRPRAGGYEWEFV